MKTLIIAILIHGLGHCSLAFAGNWYPVGKENANTVYSKQAKCEALEGQDCLEISGKDLRRYKVAEVDDATKPIYRPVEDSPKHLSCDNFRDCQEKARTFEDSEITARVCGGELGTEKWDLLENHPKVSGVDGPWFIWCELRTGFGKKPALVADPGKIAQAEAADAAKAQERATRAQKRQGRVNELKACATKSGGLSDGEKSDCIKALAKELMKSNLQLSEL